MATSPRTPALIGVTGLKSVWRTWGKPPPTPLNWASRNIAPSAGFNMGSPLAFRKEYNVLWNITMKILNVVGARPNFMKIAPIVEEMKKAPDLNGVLVHTGQHYDEGMSDVFFRDLGIPVPDVYLGVGSGSHAEQTARIMVEFEKVCVREQPDLVLVVGDVNSTMACTIVAAKLLIPVAHVEAGLRSFDRSMPEEINRLVTDALSSILFTTSRDADENLKREGVDDSKIFFVGNVMIDTLLKHRQKAAALQMDKPKQY